MSANKRPLAEPLGMKIVGWLRQNFRGDFIDIDYTSRMETTLDEIASGKQGWHEVVTTARRAVVDLAQRSVCVMTQPNHCPRVRPARCAHRRWPERVCMASFLSAARRRVMPYATLMVGRIDVPKKIDQQSPEKPAPSDEADDSTAPGAGEALPNDDALGDS